MDQITTAEKERKALEDFRKKLLSSTNTILETVKILAEAPTTILTTGVLLSGQKFSVLLPYGFHFSKALKLGNEQSDLDFSVFLMSELVLIEGNKMPFTYYALLSIDDYMAIMAAMNDIMNKVNPK